MLTVGELQSERSDDALPGFHPLSSQVSSAVVEPILIAAGGGGASDSVGARNSPNARGFISPRKTSKEDIMGRVRDADPDAGEQTCRNEMVPQLLLCFGWLYQETK